MTPETRQNHLSSINIINVFSDTSNTHDHIKITPWEREMNHIATGRALSLGGELLPPHHGSQQRRWRWRWCRWRWLRGQFPVPAACRNRDSVPRNLSSMAAALRNSSGNMTWYFRVYASGGINRRRGDVGGAPRGPNHRLARPHLLPRRHVVWPPPSSSSFLLHCLCYSSGFINVISGVTFVPWCEVDSVRTVCDS